MYIYLLRTMMKFLILILLFAPGWCISQTLEFETSGVALNVTDLELKLSQIDSLLNSDSIEIILVKLKPICEDGDDCYEETIINDSRDPNARFSDSLYGTLYFTSVRRELIDTVVPLNKEDHEKMIELVLEDDYKLDPNQLINWCYNPRHAAIIKDSKGIILAIYEVCFECDNIKIGLIRSRMIYSGTNRVRSLFKKYNLIND